MHADEIVLFLAVIVLALALVVVLVAPRFRPRRRDEQIKQDGQDRRPAEAGGRQGGQRGVDRQGEPAGEPPAVRRPAAPGHVVRRPRPAAPPHPPPLESMVCPTCRRQYAGGLKFCPYDARVLAREAHPGMPEPDVLQGADPGKICPSCARKYDVVAVVCGRDGSALVSVN